MEVILGFEARRRRAFPWLLALALLVSLAFHCLFIADKGVAIPLVVSLGTHVAMLCELTLQWGIAFGSGRRDVLAFRAARGFTTLGLLASGALVMVPAGEVPPAGRVLLLVVSLLTMALGVLRLVNDHGHLRALQGDAPEATWARVASDANAGARRISEVEARECFQDRASAIRMRFA